MKTNSKAISFVSLLALIASMVLAVGIKTEPVAALSNCDAAQFVSDVTVPDGTSFYWGVTFLKTWRLKNVSTCTWTTAYNLIYVGGDQMGAPSSVPFPQTVAPGQTVDLSVSMTAPNAPGTFVGYWELQDSSGAWFGIGSGYSHSFWVKITTTSPQQLVTVFDFTQNICSAKWLYDGGPIPCPLNPSKSMYGTMQVLNNPTLETGVGAGAPSLLMVPQNKYNASIRGIYPVHLVPGDHFQTTIGCQYQAYTCNVTFELDYDAGGSLVTIWKAREKYDGLVYPVDIDLTSISHQKLDGLVLIVSAYGDASGAQAIWVAPRIIQYLAGPVVTPTPTNIPTNTPIISTLVPSPTPSSIPAASCNRAQFVSDVSVPNGTTFAPNVSFAKIWQLQNVGTCTWTTAYRLVFVSGDRMSAPSPVLLPQAVVPGQTVDIGVNLVAPPTAGEYRGYWELADPSGVVFGSGTNANTPFLVDIIVSGTTPPPTTTAYDFAANVCTAQWTSGAGTLPCPGTDGDSRGFVLKVSNPQLENGSTSTSPGLITFPQNISNGYIRGAYPAYTVQSGDHFQSIVNCAYGATQCNVIFRLDYQVNGGIVQTFWSWAEKYDGLYYSANIDLTPLTGENVNFMLTVYANGNPTGDRAVWVAPQIVRTGAGGVTPTLTITNTPIPSVPTFTPTMTNTPQANTPIPSTPTFTSTATNTPRTNTPIPSTPTFTSTATNTPRANTPIPSTPTSTPSATNTLQPNTLLYLNQNYGFEFDYPTQGQITNQTAAGAHITLPFTSGTNLVEKYMDVNVATNATAATCISPTAQQYAPGFLQPQQVTFNGINFVEESGELGTAGSFFDWAAYSTLKGTNCISLTFTLHSSDPGVFPTPPPVYNKQAESAVFTQIVSSFAFLGP